MTGTVTVTTPDMTGTDVEVTVSRDIQEMAKYFNMIRYRVGLPGPALGDFNEVERFEQIIRNERQVELFNEGYRYFDTRRWVLTLPRMPIRLTGRDWMYKKTVRTSPAIRDSGTS